MTLSLFVNIYSLTKLNILQASPFVEMIYKGILYKINKLNNRNLFRNSMDKFDNL